MMHFQAEDPQGKASSMWDHPLPLNTWHKYVMHIKMSEQVSTGSCEIWYDGVKQTLTNGQQTIPCAMAHANATSYWKWGVYRSGAGGPIGQSVHYLQHPMMGTTYEDVANDGPPTPPGQGPEPDAGAGATPTDAGPGAGGTGAGGEGGSAGTGGGAGAGGSTGAGGSAGAGEPTPGAGQDAGAARGTGGASPPSGGQPGARGVDAMGGQGCGCRLGSSRASQSPALFLVVVGIALALRRRARRDK
jgi:MYXO-CTERM domain-containing protein